MPAAAHAGTVLTSVARLHSVCDEFKNLMVPPLFPEHPKSASTSHYLHQQFVRRLSEFSGTIFDGAEACHSSLQFITQKQRVVVSSVRSNYYGAIQCLQFNTERHESHTNISDYTAFMYMGDLIEHGNTNTVFTNPTKKQTEDYITGRYG